MNSRQRLLAVLDRQPVDRIPIDIWYTPEVFEVLAQHAGTREPFEIYRRLGIDKIVWINPPYRGELPKPRSEGELVTLWGARMKAQQTGNAEYAEYSWRPLADADDADDDLAYPHWPDPEKFDIDDMERQVEAARGEFLTLGPWVSFFEIYCQMRGLEEAMCDVLAEPEMLAAGLDKIEAIQTRLLERFLGRVGNRVDAIFYSDDMGSQSSLLISPDAWDQHLAPRVRRWCDLVHSHGVRVFYHSDGAVDQLIPRLIDCGIDILNPIQHRCPGMDRRHLKDAYGKKIIFHGGVDTQKALPFGTPDDVRQETRECLEILGEGGEGFICCSCHNIQAGTPLENILAMIETVHSHVPARV